MPNLKNKTKFIGSSISKNSGWLEKYGDGGLKSVTGPAPKFDAKTEAEGKRIASGYNNANKQNAQISQTRNWSQADQEHSDRVKARINNPASDLGILGANIASNITRFRNLTPEEIARVTDNPGETINLSSEMLKDGLINELVGYGATKAIPFLYKSAKAAGKYLTEETFLKNVNKLNPWAEHLKNPNIDFSKYFKKIAINEKKLQNKVYKKKIDFKQSQAEQKLYEQKLLKNLGVGEKIGQGNYGSVYELTSNPSKVIKIGNPMSSGQMFSKPWTPELIENLKSIKQNANIAIPEQVQNFEIPSLWKGYGPSKKEVMHMPNLNENFSANLNLNKRDRYALFLKQARQLRDKGIKLDVDNLQNFKFNKNKGVFDIYDVNPSHFENPVAYMQFVKEKTRGPLFERMPYKYGGWLDTYEDGGETDPPVNLRSASTQLASPVSTQAPEVPLNKTGWDWVKQKYENRQPSEWNMLMMDKSGSYVDSGVDPFSLMLTAPQQVIKAGVKGGKALLDASKSNKIKQVIHEDVKLVSNAKRSQELDGEAFSIYKGNKNVGEISGKRLSNGDFEVSDIGVDSQFQKQGIGTQVYKQLNQSLEPGNKVKSWGAFVENNGIAPGKSTWQSLEKQGLAKLNEKGTYEMLPKELPSSSNKFKSEIDWENWVKYKEDFYDNPELIQHLNEIEKTSKANRTWMKNPDGSPFQGTKEQFVVQQSDNFKKAFPNAVKDKLGNTQYNYHGSPNKLDFFDESKAKGVMYGKGVYTTSDKLLGKKYIENNPNGELYELYINSNKPQNTITNKDFFDYQNKQKKLINSAKNTNNETLKEKIYKDIKKLDDEWGIKYDENVKNQSLKEGFDFLKVDENQVTPFSNFLKSAKGNIKFDMTNPNIYKAAIPIGLGVAASQNKQDNSQWLNKYK